MSLHSWNAHPGAYAPNPRAFWTASFAFDRNIKKTKKFKSIIFDKDYLYKKPDNTYRIIFMGDSQAISDLKQVYTFYTYPKLVEQKAKAQNLKAPEGKNLEIINAGISGYTSYQGYLILSSYLLDLEPDLVMPAFGYHEASPAITADKDAFPENKYLWKIRSTLYKSEIFLLFRNLSLHLQAEIADKGGNSVKHRTCRVTIPDFKKNLKRFITLGNEHNFRVIFITEPYHYYKDYQRTKPYRIAEKEVAAKLDVPVIDACEKFRDFSSKELDEFFEINDMVHFRRPGAEKMADIVLEGLIDNGILTK
ncbi:MAG: hypothetical protein K6G50_06465 [bacterium]|nr:hypothetical protein [bacterium]